MFEIYDGRLELFQWDIDRKLIVKDENITQVHFCNHSDDCSLVCEIYNENGVYLVDIPNVLLQDEWAIKVYGYDKNYTKHEKVFRVKGRTKPADYVYTETEILRYEDLKDRVDEIEKNGVSDERVADAIGVYFEENPLDIPSIDGLATEEYVDKAIENIDISEAGTGCNIGMAGTGQFAEIFNHYTSNKATGAYSTARGYKNTASGNYSIAEGESTTASGVNSHSEGAATTASGNGSHAEGILTVASGYYSHSEGVESHAEGMAAHAEGAGTIAASDCQHAEGKHNIADDEGKYILIVGNGADDENRSNAHTLDWFGNAWFAGDVYIGSVANDEYAEKLATENYVNQVASNGVDLSEYVTETELNSKGYLTEHQDLTDYATKDYVDEMLGVIENGTY